MTIADPRARLAELARGENNLSALSRALGRNVSYLHGFVSRGRPERLGERDRRWLADHFGIDQAELGGSPPPPGAFRIDRYDVAASAGPGSLIDADIWLGSDTLDPALARRLGLAEGSAAIVRVRGTSMEPTLWEGDHLVVDLARRTAGARGRPFVLRIDGAVMVKRVAKNGSALLVTSDNPDAAPVTAGQVELLGEVVWRMGPPR